MGNNGNKTAKLIASKKAELLEVWIEGQMASATLREDLLDKNDLLRESKAFLDEFIKVIDSGNLEDIAAPEYEGITKMVADISISRARMGFSPSETASYIFSLKDAILQFFQAEYGKQPDVLNREVILYFGLLDKLGLLTTERFMKAREEIILDQQKAILEISTPVMTVWEKILCVPLIGTLDSLRTQQLMEVLLQRIVDTQSRVAILDVSGIPTIDTEVANHLLRTVTATRLLGGECIITGINSRMAQTMVHLGVDLSTVVTCSTMADGLAMAFDKLGLDITTK